MLARLALGNVRKSLRDFGVYFLTVVLGVAVFYAFNSMTAQQGVLALSETQDRMFDLLGMVVGGVSVFIAFVLVFLVVYANRFLVRRRKKEFGLYLVLGMRTSDVVRIVAWESLVVGAASLAVGLVVGLGLSQLLLWVTSALFEADVAQAAGFAFVFSPGALGQTVAVFAAIFVLAAVVNARTVSRARLVDLLHAESRHEELRLRNLPLSFVLFLASLALIGTAYRLLLENGLLEPSPEFAAATALVCVGTVLFFYALSGFLLRLAQTVRPLYLRGLNMFTLRQLSARVNTTFASLSVVCLVLFLAITSVCGGIGIRNTLEGSLEKSTPYSASVTTNFGTYTSGSGYEPAALGPFGEYAQGVGFDMVEGMRHSVEAVGAGDFDAVVAGAAQVDLLVDPADGLVMDDVEQASGLSLADFGVPGVRGPAFPGERGPGAGGAGAVRVGGRRVRRHERFRHHERVLPGGGGAGHRACGGRHGAQGGGVFGRLPVDHAVSPKHRHRRGAGRSGAAGRGHPAVGSRRAVRHRCRRGGVRADGGSGV